LPLSLPSGSQLEREAARECHAPKVDNTHTHTHFERRGRRKEGKKR
jgi:hypothetical protein